MSLIIPGDRFSRRPRLERIQRIFDFQHEVLRDRLEQRISGSPKLQAILVRTQDRLANVTADISNETVDVVAMVLGHCHIAEQGMISALTRTRISDTCRECVLERIKILQQGVV